MSRVEQAALSVDCCHMGIVDWQLLLRILSTRIDRRGGGEINNADGEKKGS